MTNETIFAARVNRIKKEAVKADRKRRSKSRSSLGSLMVMPLMTVTFMAGGVVAYWEMLERPTANPLQFASDLTAQLLAYLG